MSRLFQKSASDHSVSVSGPEEEEIKKRKEVKGSSSLIPKKEKIEKKANIQTMLNVPKKSEV